MIARIRGTLESVVGNTLLLRALERPVFDAGGAPGVPVGGIAADMAGTFDVWIEVAVPAYLAVAMAGSVGKAVTLWTTLYLEGQNQGSSFEPRLIGFGSLGERAFFDLFTTVKGIGNKRGLRALAEQPGVIAAAIMRGDARALAQLPEVGKRLAETIIAELKGKADAYADLTVNAGVPAPLRAGPAATSRLSVPEQEASAALMNLGQKRDEAERNVARITATDGAKTWSVDEIVRAVFAGR